MDVSLSSTCHESIWYIATEVLTSPLGYYFEPSKCNNHKTISNTLVNHCYSKTELSL